MELLEQHLELVARHLRAPLVDLGVRALGRVDDGGRRPRLLADADEVVQDRLGGQLLDDARAGAAAGEARRDDRDVEPLQRPGDVDPLAAGEREPSLARWRWPSWKFGTVSVRSSAALSVTVTITRRAPRGGRAYGPRRSLRVRALPGRSTAFAATSGERARTVPRSSTCTSPSRWPCAGPAARPRRGGDDALDERPLDVDDAQRGLRGDEPDARPSVGGRDAVP